MSFIFKLLIIVIMLVLYAGSHEITHKVIAMEYGCTDIQIKVFQSWSIPAYTEADCSLLSSEERNSLRLAQSINEIIGYTVLPLLYFIVSIIIFSHIDKK